MTVSEIQSKSILIKRTKIDSWFLAGYGMNLYRGCTHGCTYCDGQAESYRVEGVFGEDVSVKTNALTLLRHELDPARKRKPFNHGFVLLGGGVGDSYQPLEERFNLTRGALELLAGYGHPVQLLTKSTLVLRDLDLIKKINQRSQAIVSFSFSSVDEKMCSIFEPGVPGPSERLEAIRLLKKEGLTCGVFLMPVIPFLSDSSEQISASIGQAKAAGVDFVIFGGMTLKEGRQKDYFMQVLKQHFPDLAGSFDRIFPGDRWGGAIRSYYQTISRRFYQAAQEYAVPIRIPMSLCKPFISENELIYLVLEQMDYILKSRGLKSSLGYLAFQLSALKTPVRAPGAFSSLKQMTPTGRSLIQEILETGDCLAYQKLMNHDEVKDEY